MDRTKITDVKEISTREPADNLQNNIECSNFCPALWLLPAEGLPHVYSFRAYLLYGQSISLCPADEVQGYSFLAFVLQQKQEEVYDGSMNQQRNL